MGGGSSLRIGARSPILSPLDVNPRYPSVELIGRSAGTTSSPRRMGSRLFAIRHISVRMARICRPMLIVEARSTNGAQPICSRFCFRSKLPWLDSTAVRGRQSVSAVLVNPDVTDTLRVAILTSIPVLARTFGSLRDSPGVIQGPRGAST